MAGATHLLGHTVGRYHIESVIGTGGFATVYQAVDTALERSVALKVVDPSAHRSPTIGRRFILEGRAVASLNHPAVVPVYDTGEQDGVLWLAMRLIDGRSLDDAIVSGRRFTHDEICQLVGRIGAGLDHAHARGIVHRDVKPSNILLEDDDPARAWLTDFGIAATARTAGLYTTGVIGTAAYMAPEQSRPSEVGPLADIYSLACVVYELVAGRRAFEGDDYVGLLLAHATAPVPPIGQPALDPLFARALAKAPEQRPASGEALADEVRQALTGLGPDAPALLPVPAEPSGEKTALAVPAAAEPGPRLDPTVVDHSDRTLMYSVPPPPATPSVPVPPAVRPAPPGPPGPGPQGPGQRPPPPQPRYQPQRYQPPRPPRDPTVVRNSRRGARRSFAAGAAILLVGAAAGGYAYAELTSSDWTTQRDAAGVRYDVRSDWADNVQAPTVTWNDGGETVMVVSHEELSDPDETDAATLLADAEPDLCLGDTSPALIENVPNAASAAACNNADGEPATAVAAIFNGELWLFQLQSTLDQGERDHIVGSIEFGQT